MPLKTFETIQLPKLYVEGSIPFARSNLAIEGCHSSLSTQVYISGMFTDGVREPTG
jgi:hypothetical protein